MFGANAVSAPWRSTRSRCALQEINNCRQLSCFAEDEDEATHELRQVLGLKTGMHLHDSMPTLERQCLSGASTSATTPHYSNTPPPPSTPRSPEADTSVLRVESPIQSPCLSSSTRDKGLWRQVRKIFVGGIPQRVDETRLCQMFSQIGKIEKAWLQQFHDEEVEQRGQKRHRGFGFVVFQEKSAIDTLLGDDFSKFVRIDTIKLEVKRAVGRSGVSMNAQDEDSMFDRRRWKQDVPRRIPGQTWQSGLNAPDLPSSIPGQTWQSDLNAVGLPSNIPGQTWQTDLDAPLLPSTIPGQKWQSNLNAPCLPRKNAEQTWQSDPCLLSSMSGQTWQSDLRPSSQVFQSTPWLDLSLPPVPPPPQPSSSSSASEDSFDNRSSFTAFPEQPFLQQTPPPPMSIRQILLEVLLDGFIGRKPTNMEELKAVLLEAMPHRYSE